MGNAATTDYIAALCRELSQLARKNGQESLAQILEMALLEAEGSDLSMPRAADHEDYKKRAGKKRAAYS